MPQQDGGIRLDVEQVRAQLHNVYDLATAKYAQVQQWGQAANWEKIVAQVASAPPKTYLASLATALIARSTSAKIDATALMMSSGPGGYSAATVARELVGFCSDKGISLRDVGPVPFNNSPFTGKRHVETTWDNVAEANRHHLHFLRAALDQVNQLSRSDAEKAAAVLLRQRLDVSKPGKQLALASGGDGPAIYREVARRAAAFIAADPESGRRGQAFVAAVLSLAYPEVESAKINDPSRKHPGDVRAGRDDEIAVYAEVKQKVIAGSELDRFAGQIAGTDRPIALYAAFANGPATVPLDKAAAAAVKKHGVLLAVYTDPVLLARDAAIWSGLPSAELAVRFDSAFSAWLVKMGCRDATAQEWATARDA